MNPQEKRQQKMAEKIILNLKRRHFDAYYCHTAEEIIAQVKQLMEKGSSVTWGGSMSIRSTGLTEALKNGESYLLLNTGIRMNKCFLFFTIGYK